MISTNRLAALLTSLALVGGAASCASGPLLSSDGEESPLGSGAYVKLIGGLTEASDMDLSLNDMGTPSTVRGDADIAAGYLVGLGLGYRFDGGFAVEVESTRRSSDVNDVMSTRPGAAGLAAPGGSMTATSVMCNLLYRIERPWRLKPYVGLGVGFAYSIEAEFDRVGGGPQTGHESDAIAAQLMLGASTSLAANLDGVVEWRTFRAFSPETEFERAAGMLIEDYRSWSLLFGLRYRF